MPLFPIAEILPEAGRSADIPSEITRPIETSVLPSNDEVWLKVGQSYGRSAASDARVSTAPREEHHALPAGADPSGSMIDSQLQSAKHRAKRSEAADVFELAIQNSIDGEAPKENTRRDGFKRKAAYEERSSSFAEAASRCGNDNTQLERRGVEDGFAGQRKGRSEYSSLSSDRDSNGSTSFRYTKKGRKKGHKDKKSRNRQKSRRSDGKSNKKQCGTSRRRATSRSASDGSISEDDRDRGSRSRSRRSTLPNLPDSELFVVDSRCDSGNLAFGGFYRLDVPLYHGLHEPERRSKMPRDGGSANAARYFGSKARRASTDGHIARVHLWRGEKRRDQALLWADEAERAVDSKPVGTVDAAGTSGYTRNAGGRRRRESPDFLPIDPTVMSPDEDDGHSAPDADEPGKDDGKVFVDSLEQRVVRRTKEFNRRTRERPKSEQVWLQFADFQDEAVRAIHGDGTNLQSPSAAVSRMILEKKASVLEGALRRNPGSITLRIAQLQLADELQEHGIVDSLWEQALAKTGQACTMWLRYLKFKAGHFASFSAAHQRDRYAQSIRALVLQREQGREAHEKEERAKGVFILGRSMVDGCKHEVNAEADMLDILWSYCVSERAAGYEERALGALQAMAELNIRSNGSIVSMENMERYWESEAPRIGDAHPSQAGLELWLESQTAPRVKLDPSPNLAKISRPAPSGRPVGFRSKRKRAVDFFTDMSSATDQAAAQPSGSVEADQVGARDMDARRRGDQADGRTGYTDVLENAYRAAVAMSAAVEREAASRQEQIHAQDESPRADSPQLCQESSPGESVSAETLPEQRVVAAGDTKGKSKESPLGAQPDPHGESGAGAVDAEGLIWVDESQGTAYSIRHGYRIDVQGALDSVSGLEYGRILRQIRGGETVKGHAEQIAGAAAAASQRQRSRGARARAAELLEEAAVLEDVPYGDPFCTWAEAEDKMTRREWQPIRATEDPERAEEQPDRVVFVEDLKPLLFTLSHPASLRILVGMLLSVGGLEFPRSGCSHSPRMLSEAAMASSFGDGGSSIKLLVAVDSGLQAVWNKSGGALFPSDRGVAACVGRRQSVLPPLAVSSAADQFLLLTDEVVGDPSRQTFLRNVLHHLVRALKARPTTNVKPDTFSASALSAWGTQGDILVELQCALMMFEGWLASGTRGTGTDSTDDNAIRRHEARRVAKSLLEASQASATDLRLWCSYVQLLVLLDSREEAVKVAEKALSMVEKLPEDKKPPSAELFWLAFRLQAGLPLSPRDSLNSLSNKDGAFADLFRQHGGAAGGSREMALRVLCSFAEGSFKRSKTKKSQRLDPLSLDFFGPCLDAGCSVAASCVKLLSPCLVPLPARQPPAVAALRRTLDMLARVCRSSSWELGTLYLHAAEGSQETSTRFDRDDKPSRSVSAQITAPRLMAARRLMAERVAQISAELPQGTNGGASRRPGEELDMTLPLMYYSAAWVWLEYLTRGPACAEQAMSDSLNFAKQSFRHMGDGPANGASADHNANSRLGGTSAGNQPYSWNVVPEDAPLGVCLERMHRAFCELLVLAQHYDPAATGPRMVRTALLRGLQSFPCEPGMLAMLMDAEKFSGSQQRLVHHLSEVSRRRALTWEQGPTAMEWIVAATHQVMRCVSEARQATRAPGAEENSTEHDSEALKVKNWPDGSYARLKRSMEAAVTHPTGRGIPLLWRMYISLEAMRGHYMHAKRLFWRAIHACPGSKMVWMDAMRGEDNAMMGVDGLRPAFRTKELNEVLDALLEKSLHLRAEPPLPR